MKHFFKKAGMPFFKTIKLNFGFSLLELMASMGISSSVFLYFASSSQLFIQNSKKTENKISAEIKIGEIEKFLSRPMNCKTNITNLSGNSNLQIKDQTGARTIYQVESNANFPRISLLRYLSFTQESDKLFAEENDNLGIIKLEIQIQLNSKNNFDSFVNKTINIIAEKNNSSITNCTTESSLKNYSHWKLNFAEKKLVFDLKDIKMGIFNQAPNEKLDILGSVIAHHNSMVGGQQGEVIANKFIVGTQSKTLNEFRLCANDEIFLGFDSSGNIFCKKFHFCPNNQMSRGFDTNGGISCMTNIDDPLVKAPRGTVILWNRKGSEIPQYLKDAGWEICQGSAGKYLFNVNYTAPSGSVRFNGLYESDKNYLLTSPNRGVFGQSTVHQHNYDHTHSITLIPRANEIWTYESTPGKFHTSVTPDDYDWGHGWNYGTNPTCGWSHLHSVNLYDSYNWNNAFGTARSTGPSIESLMTSANSVVLPGYSVNILCKMN